MKVVFLTLDEVIALQADQLERYGGRLAPREVEDPVLGIASGRISKAEAAVFVQRHLRSRSAK